MTMSDRIDHAAEAQRCLAEVDDPDGHQNNLPVDWCGISGNEQWMVSASFAEAQVHATLALVEEQRIANEQARIANIIAIANNVSEDPDVTVTAGERAAWLALCDEGAPHSLRPEIREALGL